MLLDATMFPLIERSCVASLGFVMIYLVDSEEEEEEQREEILHIGGVCSKHCSCLGLYSTVKYIMHFGRLVDLTDPCGKQVRYTGAQQWLCSMPIVLSRMEHEGSHP